MLPHINTPFDYISGILGASTDELKLISSFLLSYPLSGILKRIPDGKPWQKNVFIISVALFYLVGLFDLWDGLRTMIWSASGAYAISYYIEGPFMPWIGFGFLMGHLSVSHLYRQFVDQPHSIDITGAQMVMVMKLSAFCWNVHDGRLPEKDLSDHQKDRAIRAFPDALDYAGYVLFFPSLLVGPAFDFIDYRSYISTSMFVLPPGTSPSSAPTYRKKRKIPRSSIPSFTKAAQGLVWIFAFLKFSSWYNTEVMLSEEYMQYWFPRRVWILHMFGFTTRMKYYGVWSLTEGACIMSGIGYRGIDAATKKPAWDRLENVKPWNIEFAQNSHEYLGNWNINTNHWLRNYVYLRVTPKGRKPGFKATLATFFTSAFWHGFYPGYYLTFVLASFMQHIAKNTRRLFRPFFMKPVNPSSPNEAPKPTRYKPYYDAFTTFTTQLAFSFTVAPFILLTLPASILVWARVYFYAIIGVAISLGFLASPGKAALQKKLRERQQKAMGMSEEEGKEGMPPLEKIKTPAAEQMPTLGLPDDPEKELDEIVDEVRKEVERRRKEGGGVGRGEIKGIVQEKLDMMFGDQAKQVKKEN
ncbi:MBOAT, membrane-bound O-acyltransferase family-domain-containing protein [Lineolata rhizophorae]|uniref:MBOAT, membrane-bound O-acyltransferase family-domain-containing protein n=1 Tax=Lineolata rhizophorae TaxID=578093 RepID=A0A6A6NZZ3_9PEZI|nr:MBOAT, membrane-bound O-acyltransferase family-domain-containing protein [Lineolata rhizophorae]